MPFGLNGQVERQVMVKCSECGLLSVRDIDTNEVKEAVKARVLGKQLNSQGVIKVAKVICTVDKRRFSKPKTEQLVAEEVKEDYECDSFQKYIPGKSSKEHEEMSHVEKMRLLYLQHREEDKTEARRHRRVHYCLAAVSMLTAIIAVVVSCLTFFYK